MSHRYVLLVAATLIGSCDSPTETRGPLHVEALTATSLVGTVREDVTPVPTVRVTNLVGQPVAGIEVSFQGVGGTVSNTWVMTDASGSATVGRWVLGTAAREYTVTAHVGGAASVVFTASANPGPVSEIVPFGGNGQTGFVQTTLSNPLRVAVADAHGNRIGQLPVTFTLLSGDGSIDGGTVLTDSDGIATSGVWTLGPTPGIHRVSARAADVQTAFTAYACDDSCRQVQLLFVLGGGIVRTNLLGEIAAPVASGYQPAWSPNGQRIAFVRDATPFGQLYLSAVELYLADADGANVVRRAIGFHSPAWSPDGSRLAVAKGNCIYDCDVYLMSVADDGTALQLVARLAAEPAWSPDGTKIAFVSLSGDDGYHALHVMNADGSNPTAVTVRDPGAIFHPSWSPDGQRIAFSKCLFVTCDIFTVKTDGTGIRQITRVGRAFGTAWSPDGVRIAFTLLSASPNSTSIAYVAADGGDPIVVSPSGSSPAWRP